MTKTFIRNFVMAGPIQIYLMMTEPFFAKYIHFEGIFAPFDPHYVPTLTPTASHVKEALLTPFPSI